MSQRGRGTRWSAGKVRPVPASGGAERPFTAHNESTLNAPQIVHRQDTKAPFGGPRALTIPASLYDHQEWGLARKPPLRGTLQHAHGAIVSRKGARMSLWGADETRD
jgi:hypothetical protein